MRIVYLIDQFKRHGGIEKMLSLKINHFIDYYGYEVILITTQHPKEDSFVYKLNKEVAHIDLAINYQQDKSYFHPINLRKSFNHSRKLKSTLHSLNPDVVISAGFSPEQYFLPLISGKIKKIKEFHFSGVILNKKRGKISRFMNNLLFKQFDKYDAVVVLNEDEKKYFDFDNITIIPNFIKDIPSQSILKRNKTIIAAGRIAGVKQFDHLIEVWSTICPNFPDWDLKIFGDGDPYLLEELNDLINSRSIPRVFLMGATDNLQAEMESSSIYAMTSANECFPMVLLEAQSAGLPVISYDCPNGPRNIIQDGVNGLLISNQDKNEFAKKLKILMADEPLRLKMGDNARKNVLKFVQGPVMNQWDHLIRSL